MASTHPTLKDAELPRIGDPRYRVWPRNLYSLELTAPDELESRTSASPYALTQGQKRFAATMAFFVSQAKLQRCDGEFLGSVYTRFFGSVYDSTCCGVIRPVISLTPPCDWEVLFTLDEADFKVISQALLLRGKELRDKLKASINRGLRRRLLEEMQQDGLIPGPSGTNTDASTNTETSQLADEDESTDVDMSGSKTSRASTSSIVVISDKEMQQEISASIRDRKLCRQNAINLPCPAGGDPASDSN
ncbi:hypothetical protein H1R20_g12902, partial [Candolleomyces eurysporus]